MSTDIRDVALRRLADRARTEAEMRRFLKEKDFSENEISETLEFLKEYSYIDDSAYCKEYFVYSIGKGKGRLRIEKELSEKGVTKDLIKEAIDEILEDPEINLENERTRALKIGVEMLSNHLCEGKEKNERFMAKVARRLAALGYGTDTVYYVIGKLRKMKEEE